ncbi:polysaccharide deacetylase family protein [Thauera sp. 63]|uniref:polysaccharide deacetylase family protein n=1 Tax=Thauera sp. 63 TaxID=497321 RepID=UPI0002D1211B|nr:polysaccharide deacetylase family protein [Thauera sp. 63]ENO78177.1 polysaccharide deacetylase [Thauera sp. 63]
MDADAFAKRMQLIRQLGYRVISLDEAVARHRRGESCARDIVITIDDAWLGTYRHMLRVLERYQYPATIYVTTYYTLAQRPVLNVMLGYFVARTKVAVPWEELLPDCDASEAPEVLLAKLVESVEGLPTLEGRYDVVRTIGKRLGFDVDDLEARGTFMLMSPEQVREAEQKGFDVQLHTHTHRMHGFHSGRVAEEIVKNREYLSKITGQDAKDLMHFCYPSGEYDGSLFATLEKEGVVSATTTEFGLNPPGSHALALRRILDCQTMSALEVEAKLSGFWSLKNVLRRRSGA